MFYTKTYICTYFCSQHLVLFNMVLRSNRGKKAFGALTFLTGRVFSLRCVRIHAFLYVLVCWLSFSGCARGANEMCLNYTQHIVCAQNAMGCVCLQGIYLYPYNILFWLRLSSHRAVVGYARGVSIPGTWLVAPIPILDHEYCTIVMRYYSSITLIRGSINSSIQNQI